MEYIRHAQAQPDYDPNTRHCLYGLDADLIMLGLLLHDPNVSLLREQVTFGKKLKDLESTNFFLLRFSILREYLDLEFESLRESLEFDYDLERIIDDFILLTFFIGNDFLPHLPNLHINKGALVLMYNAYKIILPKSGGYINNGGVINMSRLALVLEELEKFEREFFELKSETQKRNSSTSAKFDQWKDEYYKDTVGFSLNDEENLGKMTENYIQGLQWVLFYYYSGVASWGWFYHYHYSPKISDLKKGLYGNLDFQLGTPLNPFEQLMGGLMSDETSPILDFYPQSFEQDMNGKKNKWEAVVKIPFIDEKRLLSAMKLQENMLSKEERARNSFAAPLKFTFDEKMNHVYPTSISSLFPDISNCKCAMTEFKLRDVEAGAHAGFPSPRPAIK
ncbi:5'-3' exoribonuclease 1 [Neolecta irregularis DAH-3]|uniref:5'-3' exoribonuclease 1 n=1 Tax=Neolecta irregularis (strain DAH-3) TaxID=1198029 RepID=A0A1U7LM37_NEOID|nr:5'-3' exoribonuclease 1 [Neolecta irregularis DAH-3]|eukprot:OLL23698.1 5'-3' exoribonuclease 1 [Neolecta irregularis DAH-3]